MSLLSKILVLAMMVQLVACASKKKAEDTSSLDPQVSSQPLSFAVQGSDTGQFVGLTTVHFDYDRDAIPKSEWHLISQDADWIKAHKEMKVQVEGHCDQRGSTEYNLALGERRAKSIYNALVAQGVDKHRLTVISYGKERLLNSGETEEAYAQNRRVNFMPIAQGPKTNLSSTSP